MKSSTKSEIKNLIDEIVRSKLDKYQSKSIKMPFHEALFDSESVLIASLMQSFYTTFGMSLYEQMAVILARDAGFSAERQHEIKGSIDSKTTLLIEKICNAPINTYTKEEEINKIRKIISVGEDSRDEDRTVDVYINNGRDEIFIDITTVMPNKKESRTLRRKMLRWSAMRMSQHKDVSIKTYIGIPYNPYHPAPYSWPFPIKNCHREELLIQDELWKIFAGCDVFNDLLGIFDEVGKELKDTISFFINSKSKS